MSVCYNPATSINEPCSTNTTIYVIVGILIPLGTLILVLCLYAYLRCRQKRLNRVGHSVNCSSTAITNENNDDVRRQSSINYPCPPRYTSVSDDIYGKPPTYEQTLQQLTETNNNNISLEQIPVTTTILVSASPSEQLVESTRNQSAF